MKLPIFKSEYITLLRSNVIHGVSLESYKCQSFPFEEKQLYFQKDIDIPDDLSTEMNGTRDHDFESAIALFEALNSISPIRASSEILWASLSHTILFNYVQDRWPLRNRKSESEHVLQRWFIQSDSMIFRNALASLWWSVYYSVDESRGKEHKYDLTKVLFQNETFRTRVFGSSLLFHYKEAVIGILGYIFDHQELFNENMEAKGRLVASHFNKLGGVKQLAALPKDSFYTEMICLEGEFKTAINTDEDIVEQ